MRWRGLTAILCLSCRAPAPPAPCPARFGSDPARAASIVERLRTTVEGASLVARVPPSSPPRICFGHPAVSAITTEGVVLMDRDLDEPESAARLGHLLTHAVEGLPMAHPHAGDCAGQVDRALAQEARALTLEIRLRRALGVTARRIPYAFEDDVWRAPEPDREGVVLDYLRAHPDGAPGVDGLLTGYSRRCREAR